MTFDPKSLLTAPLVDLDVDGLVAALAQLQAAGMGGAGVKLPGGAPVRKVLLVAHGEQAAHFVLTDGVPPITFQREVKRGCLMSTGTMINGETVEFRCVHDDIWFIGVVVNARQMWVDVIGAVDQPAPPFTIGSTADETAIAEWRRSGGLEVFINPKAEYTWFLPQNGEGRD